MNEKIKDCKNDKSTYDYLQNGIKGLESYKNNYRQRYSKKKGLAKIDCYLEKKVIFPVSVVYAKKVFTIFLLVKGHTEYILIVMQ
ncbi:hypothetical protein PVIIG_06370 [Plasmodium vivax India VII]|uniref:Uncharacterized protein n=1 Tax=Plasmodium vivax India VII TaxID=1077284 RepID=A0A0J9UVA0_PLAVI|nr:hypothetical protein PVIIG_06370 [Plasmodium vivax India VII]